MNRPGIKIFAYGKNAWNAALAADFSPTSGLTLLAKKKDIPLGMSFFLGSSAFGRLHPIYFICSGGINPPGIKIFAEGKNAWDAALAAGDVPASFLGFAAFGRLHPFSYYSSMPCRLQSKGIKAP